MSYLSPAGRIQAMQAAGLYLALLNLAVFCTAFGLMSKQLSTGDPNLVWLWQFPVSRRVLFSSKLIENLFDNPTAPVTAVFYATALWIYGASFGVGLGLGTLLGMASAVTAAALRLAVETFLAQRLRRASRGAIVAFVAGLGSIVMLAIMLGDNSQLVVESYLSLISRLPSWIYWNPFTAGLGTDAMLIHQTGWWLVAPLTAMVVAWLSIEFAVHLTKDGLACAVDTVRGHQSEQRIERSHNNPYGAVVWKTMLQMRRQPEQLAQVFGTPMMIVVMLYFTGYKNVIDLATNGAPNISVAILAGVAYMLMMAAVQMMRSEAKGLWLLQCQPRPLADIVRTNARIWGVISIVISIPFVAWAVTMRPTETMTILIRVPYLLASLWLLAEVIFGLTALATNVNNEQNITFNRGGMLIPALIISDVSLAIHSQSWWAQLCTLAMMLIFNAAVRQRALVELPWLSEPIAAPPRFVYPMHGLLVVIGFESVMGLLSGLLKQGPGLTNHQITALAYIGGAVAAAAACGYWMYRSQIPFPEVTRRAVAARPLLSALALCCAAGLITIHLMKWLKIDLFAQTLNDTSNISGGSNDKWYLFGMLVIAAPVFEEWAFRGLIYRCLRRHWNVTLSVATTTVLFVTLHPITSAPALVVLGTATALTAERTGRLWPSMLIHAGYNLMVWSLWFA